MINRIVLVGRLTKDPDLKYTPNGVAVARFTLAVNRTFTNQNGEREADFPNIVVFRKQAENAANFLKKGSLVGVEGRIQTSSFDGQDGKRVFMTEVVADSVQFLESRKEQERRMYGQDNGVQDQPYNQQQNNRSNDQGPMWNGEPLTVPDDDLPF